MPIFCEGRIAAGQRCRSSGSSRTIIGRGALQEARPDGRLITSVVYSAIARRRRKYHIPLFAFVFIMVVGGPDPPERTSLVFGPTVDSPVRWSEFLELDHVATDEMDRAIEVRKGATVKAPSIASRPTPHSRPALTSETKRPGPRFEVLRVHRGRRTEQPTVEWPDTTRLVQDGPPPPHRILCQIQF